LDAIAQLHPHPTPSATLCHLKPNKKKPSPSSLCHRKPNKKKKLACELDDLIKRKPISFYFKPIKLIPTKTSYVATNNNSRRVDDLTVDYNSDVVDLTVDNNNFDLVDLTVDNNSERHSLITTV
jgi:hypothetical protein